MSLVQRFGVVVRRQSLQRYGGVAIAVIASVALVAPASAVTFEEFAISGASFSFTGVSRPVVGPDGGVWFTRSDADELGTVELHRFDPRTREFIKGTLPKRANDLVVAGGAIWVAPIHRSGESEPLYRIDPATRAVEAVPVAGGPPALAAARDGGALFAAIDGRDPAGFGIRDIVTIDPTTRGSRLIKRFTGAFAPRIHKIAAASDGAVWAAANEVRGAVLLRIDSATGQTQDYELSPWTSVQALAAGVAGDVWASVARINADGHSASVGLVRVAPGGAVEEVPYNPDLNFTDDLVVTSNGAVWFPAGDVNDSGEGYLVRVDPVTRRLSLFEPLGYPWHLALSPDGKTLWYFNFVLGSGKSGPRTLVRVSPDLTAPDTITTDNAVRRGIGTLVDCHAVCRGVARVTANTTARAARGARIRAARRRTTIGVSSFSGAAGTKRVRVRLTPRGRALLRRSQVRRLVLRVRYRDRGRTRTVRRVFQAHTAR